MESFSWQWQVQGPNQAATLDLTHTIHAAQLGDERAFTQLVEAYQGAAERVARQIMRTEEAAADAVQEAMLKVYRAMPRFEDRNFRAWLLRIVTNTCYDHLRRQKRRPAASLDEMMDTSYTGLPASDTSRNPEELTIRREQMRLLFQAIDALSPWHRDVILLIDVHGYDYSETAEQLQLPLGTVKSRLSRARAALRDRLVAADLVPTTTSRLTNH